MIGTLGVTLAWIFHAADRGLGVALGCYSAAPAFHPLARIPRFAIQGTRFQRFCWMQLVGGMC
jgi:hypothetical protein